MVSKIPIGTKSKGSFGERSIQPSSLPDPQPRNLEHPRLKLFQPKDKKHNLKIKN